VLHEGPDGARFLLIRNDTGYRWFAPRQMMFRASQGIARMV